MPFREDVVQRQHLRLRPVRHPLHVLVAEVVLHRHAVVAADGHVAVQVLALEGVGDDGLVLHADQVVEPGLPQGQDRALELPGGGVGARHRVVPGDIVLEDRRGLMVQRRRTAGQLEQPRVIRERRLGPREQHGYLTSCHCLPPPPADCNKRHASCPTGRDRRLFLPLIRRPAPRGRVGRGAFPLLPTQRPRSRRHRITFDRRRSPAYTHSVAGVAQR